jgi:hypothetical protein
VQQVKVPLQQTWFVLQNVVPQHVFLAPVMQNGTPLPGQHFPFGPHALSPQQT